MDKRLNLIKKCIFHAEDLTKGARAVLDGPKLHHIAYHLAVLALEELGKAELLSLNLNSESERATRLRNSLDDHVKKLFWAFWGPSITSELITKNNFHTYSGVAKNIHEKRLLGLYVSTDVEDNRHPADFVSTEETEQILKYAEMRVERDKKTERRPITEEERSLLQWLEDGITDPINKGQILNPFSLSELEKRKDILSWIGWLKDQFDRAAVEAQAIATSELSRKAPENSTKWRPKWQIRIRLYSSSHKITQQELNTFNKGNKFFQLNKVDKYPNQLDVVLTIDNVVKINDLWQTAYGMLARFLTAINIGSFGFFWWDEAKHTKKFYETIVDLDNKGHYLKLELAKAFTINWKGGKLDHQLLQNTSVCYASKDFLEFTNQAFTLYLEGLMLLGKIDVFFRVELNAFINFAKALQAGMKLFGNWEESCDWFECYAEFMVGYFEKDEIKEIFYIAEKAIKGENTADKITLEEVAAMKCFCDIYFHRKFYEIAAQRSKNI